MRSFMAVVVLVNFVAADIVQIDSTNWHDTFEGEWFIEFLAPWCPVCRQFATTWNDLSNSPDVKAKIAYIDVTDNPVLSFIFFVRQLPTLFHAKDGMFRPYNGSRSILDLKSYLNEETYLNTEPIPWYYSPSSFHMGVLFKFMELGMAVTRFHQYLLDSGYSTWLSVVIIGSGTIMFGLILGTILVIVFDFLIPPRPQILRLFRSSSFSVNNCEQTDQPAKRTEDNSAESKLPVDGSGEHVDDISDTEVHKRPVDAD